MARIEARPLVRRLVILALLTLGLVVQTATDNTQTSVAKEDEALICCSACEADPPPLPCRRGCSPDCRIGN